MGAHLTGEQICTGKSARVNMTIAGRVFERVLHLRKFIATQTLEVTKLPVLDDEAEIPPQVNKVTGTSYAYTAEMYRQSPQMREVRRLMRETGKFPDISVTTETNEGGERHSYTFYGVVPEKLTIFALDITGSGDSVSTEDFSGQFESYTEK